VESGARHSNDFPRPHSLADEARLLKTRTVALTECNALRLRTDSLELTARDFERWLPNDFPVGHSLDMASCAVATESSGPVSEDEPMESANLCVDWLDPIAHQRWEASTWLARALDVSDCRLAGHRSGFVASPSPTSLPRRRSARDYELQPIQTCSRKDRLRASAQNHLSYWVVLLLPQWRELRRASLWTFGCVQRADDARA